MARNINPATRLTLPLQDWPELDRTLWAAGTSGGGSLTRRRYASDLSDKSILKFQEGYGRWLSFLTHSNDLDPHQRPAQRVTYERAGAYFVELQATKVAPMTLLNRMTELRYAVKIMEGVDTLQWLTSPGGTSLEALLPKTRKRKKARSTVDLLTWGIQMMDTADQYPFPRRSTVFRDGLAIAILASRSPRLRTLMSMELGKNSLMGADGLWLAFGADDMKTGRRLEYGLPTELAAYVNRYIYVERPALLREEESPTFWISNKGGPLSHRGMQARIARLSEKEFGKGNEFRIHSFRHAVGTTIPLLMPGAPGAASAILGITPKMLEDHYNLAETSEAAHKLHGAIEAERELTVAKARRASTPRKRTEKPINEDSLLTNSTE